MNWTQVMQTVWVLVWLVLSVYLFQDNQIDKATYFLVLAVWHSLYFKLEDKDG